jgi:hypothetical protein
MALGRRREKQVDLFIPATQIAKGSGHPFYSKLGEVLSEGGFETRWSKSFASLSTRRADAPVFRQAFTFG